MLLSEMEGYGGLERIYCGGHSGADSCQRPDAVCSVFLLRRNSAHCEGCIYVVVAALLTPIAASHPGAVPELGLMSMLGELSTGLLFGLSLTLLMEMLNFSGQLLGLQFSFSLVNVLDPNSSIETPLLSQLLNTVGLLVLLAAGLDRTLLSALMHTFAVVPVGTAWMTYSRQPGTGSDGQRNFSGGGAVIGAGHGGDHAGRSGGGAGRPHVAAVAGVVCRHSAQDSDWICDPDRFAGGLAAFY